MLNDVEVQVNREFISQGRYGEFYHDPVMSLLR